MKFCITLCSFVHSFTINFELFRCQFCIHLCAARICHNIFGIWGKAIGQRACSQGADNVM